ncbi:DUF6734 family protein [Mucilaginibacter sp. Mucisp86]|uniref:DUF6734 family protein n=1 Tax=Mucilaginibacter sp. Mucisp86 TaxID=3243060 RepID=UPI0039B6D318
MKHIQSYWSLPCIKTYENDYSRFRGGWVTEKHHAISCAMSLMLLQKYNAGTPVTLYTDNQGFDWLINKLSLPYDDVKVELDCINHIDPMLWSMGKIYTYSRQTEPFLHIDNDVFMWERFNSELLAKPLIFQNFEVNHGIYQQLHEEAISKNFVIPCQFTDAMNKNTELTAINAGIIGGYDIDFYKNYCALAFEFVKQNEHNILNSDLKGAYNLYFEQLFYAKLLFMKYGDAQTAAGTLLSENAGHMYNLTSFGLVPQVQKYIHMIGQAKSHIKLALHMEERFSFEFPRFYKHISNIYKNQKIYSATPSIPTDWQASSADSRFGYCESYIRKLNHHIKDVNEDVIEALLEENFDKNEYHKLWDLYQIEWAVKNLKPATAYCNSLTYLYEYDINNFLDLEFKINEDSCQIIHLYHDWPHELTIKNIGAMIDDKAPSEGNLSPYLICRENNRFKLILLKNWFMVFDLIKDQGLKGKEIIKIMSNHDQIKIEVGSINDGLYHFLSSQAFVYNRLLVA